MIFSRDRILTTHVGSLHLLGVVSHQLGRMDAADLIGRAVALKPEFAEAHNDLGVVQAARYAGNSETTIRKHYLERLTPEDGKAWFAVQALF